MIRPMKNQATALRLQQRKVLVSTAQDAYEQAILDALDDGETVAAVSRAARASRTTVYSIQAKRARGDMPPRDDRHLLRSLGEAYAYELHHVTSVTTEGVDQ